MTGHRFHPSLLREYDIRGIVGETLHEADAGAIGRAFGTLVRRDGGTCVAVANHASYLDGGVLCAVISMLMLLKNRQKISGPRAITR